MFPEPYKTQAIENTPDACISYKVINADVALSGAFIWRHSPQGFDYWSRFSEKLFSGEIRLIEPSENQNS